MKNNQLEQDTKPSWGLNKIPSIHKPKEERILDTVTGIITRIQNDERNYLWSNTLTKLAWECRRSSRTRWPSSVTTIRSMSPTWSVVQSVSSFRPTLRTRKTMGSLCSSDSSDITLCVSDFRTTRTSLGYYDRKDPVSLRCRVFFVDIGQSK